MKNNHRNACLALFLSLALALSACCTKKDCSGFREINTVQLSGFTPEEVNAVVIEIFQSGSSFTTPTDSLLTSASGYDARDSSCLLLLPKRLDNLYEYQFTLLNSGLVYRLNHFGTRQEKCNTCFLGADNYEALENYEVNGRQQFGPAVIIYR